MADKKLKDLTKDELIKLAEEQKKELEAKQEERTNLIKYINGEFAKLTSVFTGIKTSCDMAQEHISKIGK